MLLSLGVRLYAITAVLSVLTFLSVFRRPLSSAAALTIVALVVAVGGVVGSVRVGGGVSFLGVVGGVAMEPLFTSFSLLDFIGQGDFPLVNFPRFLLGDLINLVPSALFPSKTSFLVRPEDYGYTVFAPVGALSSFFSFMINFGVLGTMAFVGLLGAALSVLRRYAAPLARVVYAMVSGCLGFTLFRDPFSVSLVKNLLQFSILVPLLLAAALHVVTVVVTASARRPAARERPA
jgi:hypothetical protein